MHDDDDDDGDVPPIQRGQEETRAERLKRRDAAYADTLARKVREERARLPEPDRSPLASLFRNKGK